jgi:hypothetical protein
MLHFCHHLHIYIYPPAARFFLGFCYLVWEGKGSLGNGHQTHEAKPLLYDYLTLYITNSFKGLFGKIFFQCVILLFLCITKLASSNHSFSNKNPRNLNMTDTFFYFPLPFQFDNQLTHQTYRTPSLRCDSAPLSLLTPHLFSFGTHVKANTSTVRSIQPPPFRVGTNCGLTKHVSHLPRV